ALDDDAGLVVVRPPPAPASPGDQLDAAHRCDGVIAAVVGLAFKPMLKRLLKSIAHGPASSHAPGQTEMWGRTTAYTLVGARIATRTTRSEGIRCRPPLPPSQGAPSAKASAMEGVNECELHLAAAARHSPSIYPTPQLAQGPSSAWRSLGEDVRLG